jgi:WD40 repeat protein
VIFSQYKAISSEKEDTMTNVKQKILTLYFFILSPLLIMVSAVFADDTTQLKTISQNQIKQPTCHVSNEWLNSLQLSPDGNSILANWNPGEARIWDIKTGELIKSFSTKVDADTDYTNVAFSPNGKQIAIGVPLTATVWDVGSGSLINTFPRDTDKDVETQVLFSHDSQYLMTSGVDGASIWDIKSGKKLSSFLGLEENSLNQGTDFSSDDQYVLTADFPTYTVTLWEAKTGRKIHDFTNTVNATFTPDAKGILTWGDYNGNPELVLWGVDTLQEIQKFGEFINPQWKVSSNNKYLFVRGPSLTLWDLQTGEQISKFPFGTIYEFFPDNRHLLINVGTKKIGETQDLYIWDIATRQAVRHIDILNKLEFSVNHMLISGDSKYAFFGHNGELHMWNIETGEQIRTFC